MSKIANDDVRHLADLSSLQMSDAEIESLRADIENIINYVNQLDELDTDSVEPTYQVTRLQNIWRSDEIDDGGVSRQQLLALAAEQSDNCIKVPKVL
jgi:aspartyl/glutamyl-tRNA(asn/gln) amidotransferase, C subunit